MENGGLFVVQVVHSLGGYLADRPVSPGALWSLGEVGPVHTWVRWFTFLGASHIPKSCMFRVCFISLKCE